MKRQMRWPLLALVVLSLSLGAQLRGLAAEGHFERTLKVTGSVELDVRTGSGTIDVRAGGSGAVRVLGTIRSGSWMDGGDDEKRVRYLESNPPIEQHGDVITIGHIEDSDLERHISISYEITVPSETRLRAASGSGDQAIEGIAGPLEASSGSGHIRVSRLGAEARVSTGSGGIELDSVKGSVKANTGSGTIRAMGVAGGLRASTGSGNVTLQQTAPGDVEVSTGSGSVRLENVHGSIHAQTASGNIEADGEGHGSWRLSTASGGVDVRLPSASGFDLHARTVSGTISTRRPMTVQGEISRREMTGKVGDGGMLLEVSTVSGNIHID